VAARRSQAWPRRAVGYGGQQGEHHAAAQAEQDRKALELSGESSNLGYGIFS
jgi:hypothetical protein